MAFIAILVFIILWLLFIFLGGGLLAWAVPLLIANPASALGWAAVLAVLVIALAPKGQK